MNASPPIIPAEDLEQFIKDVFSNMSSILDHHRVLLSNLFERQREQHPLILSVTDVVLAGAPSDFLVDPKQCTEAVVLQLFAFSATSMNYTSNIIPYQKPVIVQNSNAIQSTKPSSSSAAKIPGSANGTFSHFYPDPSPVFLD